MNKNRWLTLLVGLVAVLLGYSIVGKGVANHVASNDKSCGTYEQAKYEKNGKTLRTSLKNKARSTKNKLIEKKSIMPFSDEHNQVFENDTTIPQRFTYLTNEGYTDNEWNESMNDHVLTRKEVSPYLLRYAQLNNLDSYNDDDCTFDDIANETTNTQVVISEVCKLRLLRGRNGSFLKDTPMSQTDMLVILMRSKYGYLNESTTPWFKGYYDKAVEQGIVKPGLDYTIFEEGLTLRDFSLWMQRINTYDATKLLAQ